jgi:hypothetical protein
MKRILSAAVIAATLSAPAFAADKANDLCKALADLAATAASARISGVPKEGFDREYRHLIQGVSRNPDAVAAVQSTIDVTYRMEWAPTEARRKVWTMCLKSYDETRTQ